MKKIIRLMIVLMLTVSCFASLSFAENKYSVDVNTDGTRTVWVTNSSSVTKPDKALLSIDNNKYIIDNDKLVAVTLLADSVAMSPFDWQDDVDEEDDGILSDLQNSVKKLGKGVNSLGNLLVNIAVTTVSYFVVFKLILSSNDANKKSDAKSGVITFVGKVAVALSINIIIQLVYNFIMEVKNSVDSSAYLLDSPATHQLVEFVQNTAVAVLNLTGMM